MAPNLVELRVTTILQSCFPPPDIAEPFAVGGVVAALPYYSFFVAKKTNFCFKKKTELLSYKFFFKY